MMDSHPLYKRPLFYAVFIVGLLLLAAVIIPTLGRVSAPAKRIAALSNLRQIGQASLIYAQLHHDRLPEATDVWDYARLLAEVGLDNAQVWQSREDPATRATYSTRVPILAPAIPNQPRELTPAFRSLKPSVAVALGRFTISIPATTPIAWTRGLQPDGTWAPDSPYGGEGGHIVFAGGNVAYYRNLTDGGGQLISRTGVKTSNILDALPPGARIGEYTPTPGDKIAWAEAARWQKTIDALKSLVPLFLFLALLWLPFVIISIHRLLKKRPHAFTVLLWPLLILSLILVFKAFG